MTAPSKHVATSKTNQLGLVIILVSAFNMYQGYTLQGIAGIQETDLMTFASGISVIVNRMLDKHARKLHMIKSKLDIL